jgi:hypothetical protein
MLPIEQFTYAYLAGPLNTETELMQPVMEGNCRLAIQLYFFRLRGIFLGKDKIYLPGGYKHLGQFIVEEDLIDFDLLQPGDIVYAQNLKNKHGEPMARGREMYTSKDEWLFHLHSALYVGVYNNQHCLWHATSIENGTCIWTREKFEEYYQPISAKRVLDVDSQTSN